MSSLIFAFFEKKQGASVQHKSLMQAVLEFALHLDTFRNIDLYSQGVYQFRFSIYAVKAKRAVDKVPQKRAAVGLPLTNWTGERPLTQYLLAGDLCSRIEPASGTFFSTGMRVQYCEQVVRLNEGAVFQIAGMPFHCVFHLICGYRYDTFVYFFESSVSAFS